MELGALQGIYCGPAPGPAELWTRWNLDPALLAALVLYGPALAAPPCSPGRVDIRCDAEGTPNVVELNPLPGILPDPRDNSCFPKAARAAGMSYDELIRSVADIAWRLISGRSLLAEAAA